MTSRCREWYLQVISIIPSVIGKWKLSVVERDRSVTGVLGSGMSSSITSELSNVQGPQLMPLSLVILHQRFSQRQFIIAPTLSPLSLSFALLLLPPPPALCFCWPNNPSCESASELLLQDLKIPAPWQWSATCLPASYLIY